MSFTPHYNFERPKQFVLNPEHRWLRDGSLACAILGNCPGGLIAHDSSRDHLGGGQRNDGTLTNMDPATDWIFDQQLGRWVLNVNGASSQSVSGTLSALDAPLTMCGWAKAANWDAGRMAICSVYGTATDYRFIAANAIDPECYERAAEGVLETTSAANPLVNNTWAHFCGIWYSDSSREIFLNGSSRAADAATTRTVSANASYYIGQRGGGAYYFIGQIADAIFLKRALSVSEIADLADPSNTDYDGLIVYRPRRDWIGYFSPAAPPAGNRRRRLLICGRAA